MIEEIATKTPKEQLDALVLQAQQAFDTARMAAAGQEGFLVGLKKAQEIWDAAIVEQDSE